MWQSWGAPPSAWLINSTAANRIVPKKTKNWMTSVHITVRVKMIETRITVLISLLRDVTGIKRLTSVRLFIVTSLRFANSDLGARQRCVGFEPEARQFLQKRQRYLFDADGWVEGI